MNHGYRIVELDSVKSTMDEAAARLDAGQLRPWEAVLASHQTAGKGRHGRTWADHAGDSLLATVVAEIAMPVDRIGLIALAAGVAVAQVLEQWGTKVALKWPNDLIVDGRKLGGILIRTRLADSIVVLTGIGINLKSVPDGLSKEAVALADVVDSRLSARPLLEAILPELRAGYSKLEHRDWNWVLTEWTSRACWLAEPVAVMTDHEVSGIFRGVNSLGQIEIETPAGPTVLSSGAITRGPRRLA